MFFRQGWLLIGVVLCSACAGQQHYRGGQVAPVQEVNSSAGRVASLESALADALIQIEKIKAQTVTDTLPDMPPNARTGACYAKMTVPAQYIERESQRIVKEASEKIEVKPARTEWVEEQVVVSEAHTRIEVVPATYKWVEERTEVLPSKIHQKLVSPARYKTVSEKILAKPAEWVWRPGRGDVEKIDPESGEILHYVELPAEYKTVEKQVLDTPAVYEKVVEPAVFETVKKRVVDRPEHSREVTVPAVYKTVRVQKVVEPAVELRVVVPAEYEKYRYREKLSEEKLDWREIVCERHRGPELIRLVQKALTQRGFPTGYADGVLGKRSLKAIEDFQRQQGLATGRLSIETLEALGVAYVGGA